MVSPGRLFNTPPDVRMSPGKKRILYGPGGNLKSIHAALTRVSAALAESRNLHTRMMEAGVQKRAAHKRIRKLLDDLYSLQRRMRLPLTEVTEKKIEHLQRQINDELPNVINKERTSEKLIKEYEKSVKRYHQLARRVAHLNGTRNLNNRPLSPREKEAIRLTATIVRNMSAAQRTVRRLPLPRNMGHLVIRSAARR